MTVKACENIIADPNGLSGSYECEYLVVGTGPGGSVAGAKLAAAGKDVLFMEEGGYHPTESYTTDISRMISTLYRDRGILPFVGKPAIAFAEGRCVGGGSVINGGLIWRTPPWVLEEWESRHGLNGYDTESLKKHFISIEERLNVNKHKIEVDANLDSYRLMQGAEELKWKFVLAPRAVKDCINENYCPTGCISGAKQSMLQTYLKSAASDGARVLSNLRADKIIHKNGVAREVRALVSGGAQGRRPVTVKFDKLIMACGPLQTPHLLRRSSLSKTAGTSLEFHMNLKIAARFAAPVNAEKGTIFTVQVQEFEKEGVLFMASNYRPHYMAMTLSHFGAGAVNALLGDYEKFALYVAMIRPRSKAKIITSLDRRSPLVRYKLDPSDVPYIKTTLARAARLLFASGAVELYLPVAGTMPVKSMKEFKEALSRADAGNFEIISVHAMSSAPMGSDPAKSVVDTDGKLRGFENVLITDASILPTNIGESPQGTVMAFSSEIISRHLG